MSLKPKVCKVIEQPKSIQRYQLVVQDSGVRLTARITELACKYVRYGYSRIATLLKSEGWQISYKKVERIWRRGGLKVSQRQLRGKKIMA